MIILTLKLIRNALPLLKTNIIQVKLKYKKMHLFQTYALLRFDKFMHSHNYHNNKDLDTVLFNMEATNKHK
jgi:hypothetical protein